jgi:type II secretory pathway pseudopilin PulG
MIVGALIVFLLGGAFVAWRMVVAAGARNAAFKAIADAARAAEKEIRDEHQKQRKQLEAKGREIEASVPNMTDAQLEDEANR